MVRSQEPKVEPTGYQERTAVEKCSELMNLVQLMDMQQGRDEPFRSFVARCKGQANVCNFKTPCPGTACKQTVSHMDSTILIAVVKGLEDSLTKGEILSKVEKLDLDDTITFVEACEMGKRDLAKLGQPTLASQALEVKIKGTCWRCSQGGHYGNAEPEILKKVCKAFNNKCTKCEKVGHFAKQCKP